MSHLVIIGNGISGVTTARHVRKRSDDDITIISSETDHFFSRTALMYIYMGHMRYEDTKPYEDWFWEKNRISLKRGHVNAIDFKSKQLKFSDGSSMSYDKLVLALGSKSNKFGWPGQDLDGVQGLYSFQDLKLLEKNTDPYGKEQRVKRAVIVGGGLIGIELAEMLLSRGIPVTFLVRESLFWGNVLPEGESKMVMRHMAEHHVDLQLETELDEIISDENGWVRAVRTKGGEEIECQFVGLTAGVSPNIDWLQESELETDRGILVDAMMRTDQEDVFAIGDCAQFKEAVPGRRNIEQVWYTGRMMGETLALTLTGRPTEYRPGHWFNSAKFFDLEYQTYGWVFPQKREGEEHFYWEDEAGKKCIRINYEKDTNALIGINTFGVRLRHEVIDKWLNQAKDIDHAIAHMRDANFDPEFYRGFEGELKRAFETHSGRNIQLKKRSLKRIFG
ncbi:MAG: FAD-dependent oxidoreductase [Flavobacteriales bacterium]|nr:FAD-dependent oxidoreductase [Flavobacteriales bacterium]